MRILHLISSGGYFGAENMLVNLARGLNQLGLYSVVGVFENVGNPHIEVADRARKNSLPVILIPCTGKFDRAAVKRLRSYLQEEKIDIIHTHGYKPSFYSWLAARPLKIPLVATCHNWTQATFALRLYAFVDLLVLKRFQRVVGVSPEVVKTLEAAGVSPERTRMIPNGVEVSRKNAGALPPFDNAAKHEEFVIGTVGRLVEAKGFQYLLQAAPALLRKFPFVKFNIVGEGPFRSELEKLAESLGIQSRVLLAGKQEDMASVYSSMDIFVLASLNEGMPMTILEAMAAGKPVVATAVGGVPVIVTSEETGLLVQPGSASSLQDGLARLIEDPSLRATLAKRAKELVQETYSMERMAENYARVYEELYQTGKLAHLHVPKRIEVPVSKEKLGRAERRG